MAVYFDLTGFETFKGLFRRVIPRISFSEIVIGGEILKCEAEAPLTSHLAVWGRWVAALGDGYGGISHALHLECG